jgi:translation initiation factor 3 subunit J
VAATQNKVAASWEDEEEEEEEVAAPQTAAGGDAPTGPLKPKHLKKMKLKEQEEKRALEIAMTKARLAQQANETEAERKAREKASIEEADLEAALDAFAPTAKKTDAKADGDIESAINGMRLLSLADHEKLGEIVATRILQSNAKYALETMKVLITRVRSAIVYIEGRS